MEQILFVVLIGVIGLVRWLSQVAENKRNAEAQRQSGLPTRASPIPRAPVETEEERVRKFFEALGVPTTSEPPRPVKPRTIVPKIIPTKRTIQPIDPFPRPRLGELIPPVVQPAESFPPPIIPTPDPAPPTVRPALPPKAMAASTFEVRDMNADAEENSRPSIQIAPEAGARLTSFGARFATAESLRDAIILREIFGPPRSMQPL